MDDLSAQYLHMTNGAQSQLHDPTAVVNFVDQMQLMVERSSAPRKNFLLDTTTPRGDVIITEASARKPGNGWITLQVTEGIRRGVHEWCVKIEHQGETTDGSGLMLGLVPRNFTKYDSFISQGAGWCLSRAGKFYGHWRRQDSNTTVVFGTGDRVVFLLDYEAARMTVRVGDKSVVGEINNIAAEVYPAVSLHYRHQFVRFEYHKVHDRHPKKLTWIERLAFPHASVYLPLSAAALERVPLDSYVFSPLFAERLARSHRRRRHPSAGASAADADDGAPAEYESARAACARLTVVLRALQSVRRCAEGEAAPADDFLDSRVTAEALRRQSHALASRASRSHAQRGDRRLSRSGAGLDAALNCGAMALVRMFAHMATTAGSEAVLPLVRNLQDYLRGAPLFSLAETATALTPDTVRLAADQMVGILERGVDGTLTTAFSELLVLLALQSGSVSEVLRAARYLLRASTTPCSPETITWIHSNETLLIPRCHLPALHDALDSVEEEADHLTPLSRDIGAVVLAVGYDHGAVYIHTVESLSKWSSVASAYAFAGANVEPRDSCVGCTQSSVAFAEVGVVLLTNRMAFTGVAVVIYSAALEVRRVVHLSEVSEWPRNARYMALASGPGNQIVLVYEKSAATAVSPGNNGTSANAAMSPINNTIAIATTGAGAAVGPTFTASEGLRATVSHTANATPAAVHAAAAAAAATATTAGAAPAGMGTDPGILEMCLFQRESFPRVERLLMLRPAPFDRTLNNCLTLRKGSMIDFGSPEGCLSTVGGHVTIEVWIRILERDDASVFYQHGDRSTSGEVFLETARLEGAWRIRGGFRHDSRGMCVVSAPVSPASESNFLHVVLVFDGNWHLYLDNEEVSRTKQGPQVALELPRQRWTAGNDCVCQLAGLRVWRGGRSFREIVRDSRGLLLGDEPGLLCQYLFNEQNGNVLYNHVCGGSAAGRVAILRGSFVHNACYDHPLQTPSRGSTQVETLAPLTAPLPSLHRARVFFTESYVGLLLPSDRPATGFPELKNLHHAHFFSVKSGVGVYGGFVLRHRSKMGFLGCDHNGRYWELFHTEPSSSVAGEALPPVDAVADLSAALGVLQDRSEIPLRGRGGAKSTLSSFSASLAVAGTGPTNAAMQPSQGKGTSLDGTNHSVVGSAGGCVDSSRTGWKGLEEVSGKPQVHTVGDIHGTKVTFGDLALWLLEMLASFAEAGNAATDYLLFSPLTDDVCVRCVQQVQLLLREHCRVVKAMNSRRSANLKDSTSSTIIVTALRVLIRLVRRVREFGLHPDTIGLSEVGVNDDVRGVLSDIQRRRSSQTRVDESPHSTPPLTPFPPHVSMPTQTSSRRKGGDTLESSHRVTNSATMTKTSLTSAFATSSSTTTATTTTTGTGGGTLLGVLTDIINEAGLNLPSELAFLAQTILQEGVTLFFPSATVRAKLLREMLHRDQQTITRSAAMNVLLDATVKSFADVLSASALVRATSPNGPGESDASEKLNIIKATLSTLLTESSRQILAPPSLPGDQCQRHQQLDLLSAMADAVGTLQILLLSQCGGGGGGGGGISFSTFSVLGGKDGPAGGHTASETNNNNSTVETATEGTAAGAISSTDRVAFASTGTGVTMTATAAHRPLDDITALTQPAALHPVLKAYYGELFDAADSAFKALIRRLSSGPHSAVFLLDVIGCSFLGPPLHTAVTALPLVTTHEESEWMLHNLASLRDQFQTLLHQLRAVVPAALEAPDRWPVAVLDRALLLAASSVASFMSLGQLPLVTSKNKNTSTSTSLSTGIANQELPGELPNADTDEVIRSICDDPLLVGGLQTTPLTLPVGTDHLLRDRSKWESLAKRSDPLASKAPDDLLHTMSIAAIAVAHLSGTLRGTKDTEAQTRLLADTLLRLRGARNDLLSLRSKSPGDFGRLVRNAQARCQLLLRIRGVVESEAAAIPALYLARSFIAKSSTKMTRWQWVRRVWRVRRMYHTAALKGSSIFSLHSAAKLVERILLAVDVTVEQLEAEFQRRESAAQRRVDGLRHMVGLIERGESSAARVASLLFSGAVGGRAPFESGISGCNDSTRVAVRGAMYQILHLLRNVTESPTSTSLMNSNGEDHNKYKSKTNDADGTFHPATLSEVLNRRWVPCDFCYLQHLCAAEVVFTSFCSIFDSVDPTILRVESTIDRAHRQASKEMLARCAAGANLLATDDDDAADFPFLRSTSEAAMKESLTALKSLGMQCAGALEDKDIGPSERRGCALFLDQLFAALEAELHRCAQYAMHLYAPAQDRVAEQVGLLCTLSSTLARALPPRLLCGGNICPSLPRLALRLCVLAGVMSTISATSSNTVDMCIYTSALLLCHCHPAATDPLFASCSDINSQKNKNNIFAPAPIATSTDPSGPHGIYNTSCLESTTDGSISSSPSASSAGTRSGGGGGGGAKRKMQDRRKGNDIKGEKEKVSPVVASVGGETLQFFFDFTFRCVATSGLGETGLRCIDALHMLICSQPWDTASLTLRKVFLDDLSATNCVDDHNDDEDMERLVVVRLLVWAYTLCGTPTGALLLGRKALVAVDDAMPATETAYVVDIQSRTSTASIHPVSAAAISEERDVPLEMLVNASQQEIHLPREEVLFQFLIPALEHFFLPSSRPPGSPLVWAVASAFLRAAHAILRDHPVASRVLLESKIISHIDSFALRVPAKTPLPLCYLHEVGAVAVQHVLRCARRPQYDNASPASAASAAAATAAAVGTGTGSTSGSGPSSPPGVGMASTAASATAASAAAFATQSSIGADIQRLLPFGVSNPLSPSMVGRGGGPLGLRQLDRVETSGTLPPSIARLPPAHSSLCLTPSVLCFVASRNGLGGILTLQPLSNGTTSANKGNHSAAQMDNRGAFPTWTDGLTIEATVFLHDRLFPELGEDFVIPNTWHKPELYFTLFSIWVGSDLGLSPLLRVVLTEESVDCFLDSTKGATPVLSTKLQREDWDRWIYISLVVEGKIMTLYKDGVGTTVVLPKVLGAHLETALRENGMSKLVLGNRPLNHDVIRPAETNATLVAVDSIRIWGCVRPLKAQRITAEFVSREQTLPVIAPADPLHCTFRFPEATGEETFSENKDAIGTLNGFVRWTPFPVFSGSMNLDKVASPDPSKQAELPLFIPRREFDNLFASLDRAQLMRVAGDYLLGLCAHLSRQCVIAAICRVVSTEYHMLSLECSARSDLNDKNIYTTSKSRVKSTRKTNDVDIHKSVTRSKESLVDPHCIIGGTDVVRHLVNVLRYSDNGSLSVDTLQSVATFLQMWFLNLKEEKDLQSAFREAAFAITESIHDEAESFYVELPPLSYTTTEIQLVPIAILNGPGGTVSFDVNSRGIEHMTLLRDRKQKTLLAKYPDAQGGWPELEIPGDNLWFYVRPIVSSRSAAPSFTVSARSLKPFVAYSIFGALRDVFMSDYDRYHCGLTFFLNTPLISVLTIRTGASKSAAIPACRLLTALLELWRQMPHLSPHDQSPLRIMLAHLNGPLMTILHRGQVSPTSPPLLSPTLGHYNLAVQSFFELLVAAIRLESAWRGVEHSACTRVRWRRLLSVWESAIGHGSPIRGGEQVSVPMPERGYVSLVELPAGNAPSPHRPRATLLQHGNATWFAYCDRGSLCARSSVGFKHGRFYFEVRIPAKGEAISIGVVTERAQQHSELAPRGLGHDGESWGFDSVQMCRFYHGFRHEFAVRTKWKGNDVVGILLDLEAGTLACVHDERQVSLFDNLKTSRVNGVTSSFFPAISFGVGGVEVNFGAAPFACNLPTGYLPVDPANYMASPTSKLWSILASVSTGEAIAAATDDGSGCLILPSFFRDANAAALTYNAGRSGPFNVSLLPCDSKTRVASLYGSEVRADDDLCFVRGSVCVRSGRWYYELTLRGDAFVGVGWVTSTATADWSRSKALGDDADSWVLEGGRATARHNKHQRSVGGQVWKHGDVVGCMVDCDLGTIAYTINGTPLREMHETKGDGVLFMDVNCSSGLMPVIGVEPKSSASVTFRDDELSFLPPGYRAVGTSSCMRVALERYHCTAWEEGMKEKTNDTDKKVNRNNNNNNSKNQNNHMVGKGVTLSASLTRHLLSSLTALTELNFMNPMAYCPEDVLDRNSNTILYEKFQGREKAMGLIALLQNLTSLAEYIIPYAHAALLINGYDAFLSGPICRSLLQCRNYMLPVVALRLLHRFVSHTNCPGENLKLTLNRRKALSLVNDMSIPVTDRLRASLFGQVHQLLHNNNASLFCTNKKLWSVNFVGEGADDIGGPYRESITQLCSELMSPGLPLFIPSQNQAEEIGESREVFVVRPVMEPPVRLTMYHFIGRFIAGCLRSAEPLPIYLPSRIWKAFIGNSLDETDLGMVDKSALQSLQYIRQRYESGLATDDELAELCPGGFSVVDDAGVEQELFSGGRSVSVTRLNVEWFVKLALDFRLRRMGGEQVKALADGFHQVVPARAVSLLKWYELEQVVCGQPDYDADSLLDAARYEDLDRCDNRVLFLRQVLRQFSRHERALFMRFVSGRERLPSGVRLKIMPDSYSQVTRDDLNGAGGELFDDNRLPHASTCFYWLSIPKYSSVDVMRQKLLFAIQQCMDIDADFVVHESGNPEEEVEPMMAHNNDEDEEEFEDFSHLR